MESTSEVLKERLEKIKTFQSQGTHLYQDQFRPTHSIGSVLEPFQEGKTVKAAGRMMTRRIHGKSAFADLKDETGKIQIYAKFDVVGEEHFQFFEQLDLGDIIGVEGTLFITQKGEKTIRVERFHL